MDNLSDEAIAEALRLAGDADCPIEQVHWHFQQGMFWGKCLYALARTIDQRNKLVEALEKLACLGNGDTYGNSIGNQIAIDALTQIRSGQ